MITCPVFNPTSPRFQSNPYVVYRQWLDDGLPILSLGPGRWLVTRYADVAAALKDDAAFVRARDTALVALPPGPFRDYNYNIMAMMDRPQHTQVRGVVARAFAPRALAHVEARLDTLAEALLDTIDPSEPFDVLETFATRLPLYVICDLIGVGYEYEALLKRVSTGLTRGSEVFATPAVRAEADEVCRLMHEMLEAEIARRAREGGGREDDLISVLLNSEQDGTLTRAEVFENITFMLAAGHETTTNLILSGLNLLIDNPAQAARLRSDESLIANAVEEFLRLEPPLHLTPRSAAYDMEIGGQAIQAGESVVLCLASANRDPAMFAEPDMLDVGRSNSRDHLSFIRGIHTCLGAHLARMEGRTAFKAFLRRYHRFERVGASPVASGFIFRGRSRLVMRAG